LPKLLSQSNVGKEYWFTIPPPYEETGYDSGDSISIFITSAVRTLVTVEVPGKSYFAAQNTIANDVIMFTLYPVQCQPYLKKAGDNEVAEQVFTGAGIHIYADQPIIVYCVIHYKSNSGNISEGWLCIPTSSAGKEYIVSGYKVDNNIDRFLASKLASTCGIVAPYNDTKVVFTMGGNNTSKTAGGLTPGQSKSFTLMRGDVWMVSTSGDSSDLSGSKIVASKPVQIVTGSQCANIPVGNGTCNYTAEMDMPTFTWGTIYHVPQITNRKYPSLIRIYAKEPDTKIYKDGKQIYHLTTGGGINGQVFLETRIVGMDVKPRSVVFSGDKPIAVTLLNTGTQEDGSGISSDPFWMAIQPMEQYQTDITFCTPGLHGVFGFADYYLSFEYQADEFGMMPNDVEYAKIGGGAFTWKTLKSQFSGVDELYIPVNGKTYAHKVIHLPGDGVYRIRAKQPFAAYLYGFNTHGSFGYPASAGFTDLEKPDTIPPVPTWTLLCDGNVTNGVVKDYPDDDAVRSNLAIINMNADSSFNYIFDYDGFIPGETRTTAWRLTVIDPTQDARAVITFSDRRGNDTTIIINYYAINLSITETKWDYGTFQLNTQKAKHTFTVKNESKASLVFVHYLKLKLGNQKFTIDSLTKPLPFWMQPQESFDFGVIFNPDSVGTFRDSIGVGDTCFFWNKAVVIARVAQPIIDVTDIDFGYFHLIDSSKTSEFTITNKGVTPLIITGFSGLSNKVYSPDPLITNISTSNPIVIQPGDFKKYQVIFTPVKIGSYPDSIVFSSNAGYGDSICYINALATSINENNSGNDSYLNISSNPVNNNLKYSFGLKEPGFVDIQVIDLKGNIVQNQESVYYSGGEQEGIINTGNLLSGIYFLKISNKDITFSKKFTVMK